jgi:hypothetical protein
MHKITGKAYENITYYETGPVGEIVETTEDLANPIGIITIAVHDVLEIDLDMFPLRIMDKVIKNVELKRIFSYLLGSAITDPSNYSAQCVRAYKTSMDLVPSLALLISEWLGGCYVIVATPERGGSDEYYIWSRGSDYYMHPERGAPQKRGAEKQRRITRRA